MATTPANLTHALILDMTTLRFAWTPRRDAVTALSERGEVLAVIDADPDQAPGQLAYWAMDAALTGARLLRRDVVTGANVELRVALYNPFTMQVAHLGVPHTMVFADGSPLVIPSGGLPAVIRPGSHAPPAGSSTGTATAGCRTTASAALDDDALLRAALAELEAGGVHDPEGQAGGALDRALDELTGLSDARDDRHDQHVNDGAGAGRQVKASPLCLFVGDRRLPQLVPSKAQLTRMADTHQR